MANPAAEARAKAQTAWPGASVSRRGRNQIEHQHPSEPTRRMLDVATGPLHIEGTETEIDTAWQPGTAPWDREMVLADYNALALDDFSAGQIIKYVDPVSGEDVAFQPQQLQYTNDLDQIQAIADPQSVNAVVTDDELYWTGAYGTDIDLRWQTQTARLDKRLIVQNLAALPAVQQFIIDGGNPVLRLQFIFQHSNGASLFVDGVEWDEKPNNPVETSGIVEFRDSSGKVLWVFNLPRSDDLGVVDDESGDFVGTFRFRKTGPNVFVEHRIPVSWLQSATYPIEIDTTIDAQVGAGADDGSYGSNGTSYVNSGATIALGPSATADRAWFRWTGVTIVDGSTIDAAHIELFFRDAETGSEETESIGFDDLAAPAAPTDATDASGRTRTTTTVAWTIVGNSANAFFSSSEIKTVIQELEDSFDYSSGAAMQALVWETGETVRVRSYEHNTARAAKLHIEYTAGGAAAIPNKIIQVNQAINRSATY